MRAARCGVVVAMLTLLAGCAAPENGQPAPEGEDEVSSMNTIAEAYVKLVLAVGAHDADYVDAYYGPPGWKEEAAAEGKLALTVIRDRAEKLLGRLARVPEAADEMGRLRKRYLIRQIEALIARVDMLEGARLSFDDESQALYDAQAPNHGADHFEAIIKKLEAVLPGEGPISSRYEEFKRDFIVPSDRLDAVFKAAIDACRERTIRHIDLPEDESFVVEYVTDKSWSGYNWYQGSYNSLIQVNTDLPIFVDRAIDLACHEGYPGHHVYNLLLEKSLVRDRGWMEYSVYPLFSPQSLIAEGTANYGIDIAFPEGERVAFERETLFPLAGLEPEQAGIYYEVQELARQLNYAGNEAARGYLNDEMDAAGAADWLSRYGLMSAERAAQRVRFIDQYRSYVINYNLGQDLVSRYVEAQAGPAASAEDRWRVFVDLLSSPRLPSDLRRGAERQARSNDASNPGREDTMSLEITSTAFGNNEEIPGLYTCEGKDISPPLSWRGVPGEAKSLALIVDDPDAPDPAAPRMTWVHWVLYNISPSVAGLPAGGSTRLPAGIGEGLNDWKRTGYGGPCPPIGRHRYFHKLYALDVQLPDLGRPTKAKLEGAMQGHILEKAELIGTYRKG